MDWKEERYDISQLIKIAEDSDVQETLKKVGVYTTPFRQDPVLKSLIFRDGNVVHQFSSNPMQFKASWSLDEFILKKAANGEIDLWLHLPYWTTIYRSQDNFCQKLFIEYLKSLTTLLTIHGCPIKLMAHASYPLASDKKSVIPREIYHENCVRNLQEIESTLPENSKLTLENQVGGKKYEDEIGAIWFLRDLINLSGVEKISLCFDTEHDFAHGAGYFKNPVENKDISVVHLNGIPEEVTRGSRRDRHSRTPLAESKEKELILSHIQNFYGKVPLLLERDLAGLMLEDLKHVYKLTHA